ncbi:hypothetical protein PanWU01x14_084800, partial [Parasponia andersonii]
MWIDLGLTESFITLILLHLGKDFINLNQSVHNADSVQVASSFVRRLQLGSMLLDHLLLNLSYDMADVQAKSEGVFRVLESRHKTPKASAVKTIAPAQAPALQGIKSPAPDRGPILKQEAPTQGGQEGGKRTKVSRDPLPKNELNTPIDVIYFQNKDRGIFKDPPKSGIPKHMKNRNRCCQFHKDHGYDTINCCNLYAQVMVAIHAGKLKQYVKTSRIQPREDSTRPEKGKRTQASG